MVPPGGQGAGEGGAVSLDGPPIAPRSLQRGRSWRPDGRRSDIAPIPAAACLVAAWVAESIFDAHENLAEDPRKYDFDVVTAPVERRLYLEAFGTSEIELAALEMSKAVLSAAADSNALVRAVERAAGAAQREDEGHFARQIEAARRFRVDTITGMTSLPAATEPYAEAVENTSEEFVDALTEAPSVLRLRGRRLETSLPTETLALAYRPGISIRLLREPVAMRQSVNPLRDLAGAVRSASEESAKLGTMLETWDPSQAA